VTARTRRPAHRLPAGAALACAALALAAAPAHAEWSRVVHYCNPLGCATSFTGGPGDNVMTAEPAPGGNARFLETSPGASVIADDADFDWPHCRLQNPATSAVCPLSDHSYLEGASYLHGGSAGNDKLIIRPGVTHVRQILGSVGNDVLYANDGTVQRNIFCDDPGPYANPGTVDVAYIDPGDPPPIGCETVHVGGSSADADNTSGVAARAADTSGPTSPVMPATPLTAKRGRFTFRVGAFDEPVTGSVGMLSAPIGAAKKRIRLLRKRFAAAAGQEVKLMFQLNRAQRKRLAKARKVKMFAVVVALDALGNVSTRTVPFRLKAKRKRN
jgi:hypothetical protein